MKIAQVAPLYESVPPKLYGGTERVVSYLTEELVERGHEVTLFASGDSETEAELVSVCDKGLRLSDRVCDPLAYHFLMLEALIQRVNEFDIVHFHTDYLHFPFSRRGNFPNITTMHGRLDMAETKKIHQEFVEHTLVSISESQRTPLQHSNWIDTVYHGLPLDLYNFNSKPGQYFSFLGRITPEKRLDRAIEISERCGIPLKVAAKVDEADKDYYQSVIKPLIDMSVSTEFIGEIGDHEKQEFLGNALALLFPIDWPEPFGLVMIEAMACGTPVVAFRNGSVPEVIDVGCTGFIINDCAESQWLVDSLLNFDRVACRQQFEKRFSAGRMAEDYLQLYEAISTRSMPLVTHLKSGLNAEIYQ